MTPGPLTLEEARILHLCPVCQGYGGCDCADKADEAHIDGRCPKGDVCPGCGDDGGYAAWRLRQPAEGTIGL